MSDRHWLDEKCAEHCYEERKREECSLCVRAEVDRLTRERDEARAECLSLRARPDIVAALTRQRDEARAEVERLRAQNDLLHDAAATLERLGAERDRLRAEVERLTRERDDAAALGARAPAILAAAKEVYGAVYGTQRFGGRKRSQADAMERLKAALEGAEVADHFELERLRAIEAAAKDVVACMSHTRVFLVSREKMHPVGVEQWDEEMGALRDALREDGGGA